MSFIFFKSMDFTYFARHASSNGLKYSVLQFLKKPEGRSTYWQQICTQVPDLSLGIFFVSENECVPCNMLKFFPGKYFAKVLGKCCWPRADYGFLYY